MTVNTAAISGVWSPVGQKLPKHEERCRAELRTWLEAQVNDPVAIALTLDPDMKWTPDQMRELEEKLLEEFAPHRREVALSRCLYRVAQGWRNQTHATCSLPRRIWETKRAPNPLRFDLVISLKGHRQIRRALLKAVSKLPDTLIQRGRPDYLALAVLSGVVHFGLLHKDCILAAVSSVAKPKSSFLAINEWVCLSLSLPVRDVPDAEQRIWIPDPLTATLLLKVDPSDAQNLLAAAKMSASSPRGRELFILQELSTRIENLTKENPKKSAPRFLDAILKTCARAATVSLPFCVHAYQTRRFISHSLRPSVLARIEPKTLFLSHEYPGEGVVPNDLLSEEDLALSPQYTTKVQRAKEPAVGPCFKVLQTPDWSPILSRALAGRNIAVIRRRLLDLQNRNLQGKQSRGEDFPEIARCIAEFAFTLAQRRGSRDRPGTLRKYVSLLSRFLAPQVGDDVSVMGAIGEDAYVEAIEDHSNSTAGGSLSSRQLFAVLLLRFHNFLVKKHEAKPFDDIHAFVAGCLPVDANIISVEELFQILLAIRETRLIPDAQKIQAQLLVILGYHGLRRNEAFYLRAYDIDVGSPTYALVRNTDQRHVKTRNAIRRVNLSAFLPRKLLNELLRYRCQRLGCNKPGCSRRLCQLPPSANCFVPLFERSNSTFLEDDDLFAKIHEVMRTTLGDAKIRFHSLRHSAASLLVLSLLGQQKLIRELLPSRRWTREILQRSDALRNRIYASDQVHWSDLHVLANWIGHGSGKTTLTHYCHTFFAIAAGFTAYGTLKRDEKKALASASGRGESTVYRAGQNVVPFKIFEKRFGADIKKMSRKRARTTASAKAQNRFSSMTEFERSLLFAELFLDDSLPMGEVRARTGIPKARGEEITRTLADLMSASRKKRRR